MPRGLRAFPPRNGFRGQEPCEKSHLIVLQRGFLLRRTVEMAFVWGGKESERRGCAEDTGHLPLKCSGSSSIRQPLRQAGPGP